VSANVDGNEKQFLSEWQTDPGGCRDVYTQLRDILSSAPEVDLSFYPRPGITYSLRGKHENQTERELFVMVDVIDDDPQERWLSVCFFGDMINDPEEKGDFVPEGLLGHDAHCFDLDTDDEQECAYVKERIREAMQAAAGV